MCGLFSAISLGTPYKYSNLDTFKKATRVVSNRGPDAEGFKTYNTLNQEDENNFNIFFGHRRLSIIDLSEDGNQPMELDGNSIIFNGEIFNYLELRNELSELDVEFKTRSDTEVILKVYQKYGSKGFNKLNGMWAFIIYDSLKKIIIASRDRFSIKPLFYTRIGENVFLASEIKQLFQFIRTKNINKCSMNRFLTQGLLDINTDTFYDGIERLEAKHNIIIDLNSRSISKERYYDYQLTDLNENNIFEEFNSLMYDSVKIRLRSDVELGALLSGGLDSSAISVIGRNMTGDNFRTFTVISESKKFSEEKFADIVTTSNKIKNKKLLLESSTVKNNLDNVLICQDEPFAGFSMIAQYSILEKIKKETDIIVVLSGQGGDEVLLGYHRYYFFYLKKLYKRKQFDILIKELIASILFRTVLTQWKISSAKRYIPGMISIDKKFLISEAKIEETWQHLDMIDAQKNDIDKYSIPILTRYEDRNSMAHSLETRLPFLDHRLVEFLLSLKVEFKIKNGWNKYILRKSLNELPAKIRWRRDKKGFTIPEGDWLRGDFKEDILFNFKNSFLEQAGIIRGDSFIDYYKEYLSGNRRIHDFDISRVYIAEKWMKNNFT